MSGDIYIYKNRETHERCKRVAIQIINDLPDDVLEAFVIAAMVYDNVKRMAEKRYGELDYVNLPKIPSEETEKGEKS